MAAKQVELNYDILNKTASVYFAEYTNEVDSTSEIPPYAFGQLLHALHFFKNHIHGEWALAEGIGYYGISKHPDYTHLYIRTLIFFDKADLDTELSGETDVQSKSDR